MSHEDFEKKRITIYQVAKESGCSLATVSRVINNKDNVTEKTKARIMEVIERLGYKPSAVAQGLAKSKTTNIGIVIPSAMYTYVSSMLSGMVDIAKIYGYQTELFVTSSVFDAAKDTVEKVISSNVDGAVIFDDQLSSDDIKKLVSYSIPVAVIGREIEGENVASIPLVYDESLKTMIKKHFLDSVDPVYFLHIDNDSTLMNHLENVARELCKELEKEDLFSIINVEDSYSKTYAQFNECFKEDIKKGLFIAPRDSIACGVSNAALEKGLDIPHDISICSVIGTKYSTIARPSLTSFDIDMYEVGSIAMRMLTKLLNNTLKTQVFPFVSSIQYRSSTK